MSKLNRLIKLNNGHMMPLIGLGTFVMAGEKLQHAVEYAVNIGTLYVYFPNILVKFGQLSGRLLGNSCSFGLRSVFFVKVPDCQFMFPIVFSSYRFLKCAIS